MATQTASVVGTANYDAFGAVRSSTGQSSIFGFTGQQTDPTGLSYLRTRYYNPTTGSFMSPDVVQPNASGTQGYDRYSYVSNNPTTATDRTGQFADTAAIEINDTRSVPALTALEVEIAYVILLVVAALEVTSLECEVGLPPCGATSLPRSDTVDKPIDEPRPPTEEQKFDWREAARRAIETCLVLGIADQGLCRPPVNTYVPGRDQGAVTTHDFNAINSGQPFYLVYTRTLNSQFRCDLPGRLFKCWYDWPQYQPNSCLGSFADRGSKECDEYPFLSTSAGGPPASADGGPPGTSLTAVSTADNKAQSKWLGRFYRPKPTGCGIQSSPDNPVQGGFVVIPDVLLETTQYYCGDFNR